jgi:riboflavin synthase
MFTGLVETVGQVAGIHPMAGGFSLLVETTLAPELSPGDSLAVNGVCLTAVSLEGGRVRFDVSPETARLTTLGELATGSIVNLERPLRADSRVGGHFVQGHVDATGTVEALRRDGDSFWLSVAYPPALGPSIVHKGSIAVDGISLTVARLDTATFGVQIIPYTFTHTNLRTRETGAPVNLEVDILGKYVARAVEVRLAASGVEPARPRESP